MAIELQSDRILRLKEVKALTGLSRSTILRLESDGDFPGKKKIATSAVGWSFIAVQAWIDTKMAA